MRSSPSSTCCLFLVASALPLLQATEQPGEILAHTRSVYAGLTSYSDVGTVVKEYTATSQDRFSFTTHFTRVPRHFLFDFNKPSGDRIVIWGDPDAFHVWWKATRQVTEYPNPKNTGAITLNGYPTSGATTKIAPLLYSKAGLPGAIQHFEPGGTVAMEEVAGSRCYRLDGQTSDSYGETGKKVNVRSISVWVDATSFLIRKIIEESPTVPGMLDRVTTTFDPKADISLNDEAFRFAPPQ